MTCPSFDINDPTATNFEVIESGVTSFEVIDCDGTTIELASGSVVIVNNTGGDGSTVNFVAAETMPQGTPVYLQRSNGQIGKADAALYIKSFVIGFTVSDVVQGFAVDVVMGKQTRTDWTDLAGAASLSVGSLYFLNVGGGLTTNTPSAPDFAANVSVGFALSTTVFKYNISQPILL